jgi:hypothetical protein
MAKEGRRRLAVGAITDHSPSVGEYVHRRKCGATTRIASICGVGAELQRSPRTELQWADQRVKRTHVLVASSFCRIKPAISCGDVSLARLSTSDRSTSGTSLSSNLIGRR